MLCCARCNLPVIVVVSSEMNATRYCLPPSQSPGYELHLRVSEVGSSSKWVAENPRDLLEPSSCCSDSDGLCNFRYRSVVSCSRILSLKTPSQALDLGLPACESPRNGENVEARRLSLAMKSSLFWKYLDLGANVAAQAVSNGSLACWRTMHTVNRSRVTLEAWKLSLIVCLLTSFDDFFAFVRDCFDCIQDVEPLYS